MRSLLLFSLTLLLLLLISCAPRNTRPSSTLGSSGAEQVLTLNDTLLVNTWGTGSVAKTVLQANSKIKSVHVDGLPATFNIGLVDYNGDGVFTDPSVDLALVTSGQNTQVRINGEFGTPHCKAGDSLYLRIDSLAFLLYNIDPGGKQAKIKQLMPATAVGKKPAIVFHTSCRSIRFKKYTGGDIALDSLVKQRTYTYVYFWTARRLDYQLNKVTEIQSAFKDRVSIVGVHCKDHELDPVTSSDFFDLLSRPWNGSYCTLEQYNALNQDYSWYRGVLLDANGRIIFPHIRADELKKWLEKGN